MARSEARISVDIWDDPDFLALSPSAQRMFMFLLSQRDIAHTGVLALRERRWARSAAGMAAGDVTRVLDELAAARYVVIDEDTEELLVRSFIRRDKVYRQPNVLRSAADSLALVSSPIIRATLAVELRRVAESDDLKGDSVGIVAQMLEDIGNPSPNPSPNPPGNPSEKATSGAPGERGVVTAVSNASPSPVPQASNPSGPATYIGHPPRASDLEPPPSDGPPTLVEQIMTEYREESPRGISKSHFQQLSAKVHELLADGFAPNHIREGLKQLRPQKLGPNALPSVVDRIANAPAASNVVPMNGRTNGRASLPPSSAPTVIPPDERCPDHRGQRKANCHHCRAIKIGRPQEN